MEEAPAEAAADLLRRSSVPRGLTQHTRLRASGKVWFEMGTDAYICSGAVVHDTRSDYSLVLTAGHCAYDETNRAFATNWMFIPQFDSNPTL